MFQAIINWIYGLIVSSGILLHFLPLVLPMRFFLSFSKQWNYIIKDEGGSTMKVIKHNGKLYPAVGLDKVLAIKKVKIRNDDVMLCGFPKTGCHWVYEILHMLVTGKAEMTKHGKVLHGMIDILPDIILDSLPSPRVLNSHYLYEDLPEQIRAKKTKIVWTIRSPRDTVVSHYNHLQAVKHVYQYDGTFENFFKLFMSGQCDNGSYFDHVQHWEKAMKTQTDNPILVVEFEQLKKDPLKKVKEIARFLNIDISDEFAGKIVETSRFDSMKAKFSNNKLLRKGQVGDWQNWLTETQNQQMKKFWQDNMSNCDYQPQL